MIEDNENVVLWMTEPAKAKKDKKPKISADEKNKKAAAAKLKQKAKILENGKITPSSKIVHHGGSKGSKLTNTDVDFKFVIKSGAKKPGHN